MSLRVLQIFAQNYRLRLSGPVIQWRYYFNQWSDPGISHFVLDRGRNILPAKDALDFELTSGNPL